MQNRIFLSAVANNHLDATDKDFKSALISKLGAEHFTIEEFYQSGAAVGLAWTFENAEKIISGCAGAVVIGVPKWPCLRRQKQ